MKCKLCGDEKTTMTYRGDSDLHLICMSCGQVSENITPQQALERLQYMNSIADDLCTETGHIEADNILRRLLVSLGHADIVREYDNISKWYG